ncbi:MAG TPA: HPF/RaiA family ribosome-associated protein [Candidatus Paceibacterota bacterium]|nr:HPF/RaiA family ribosome-associated protein [Candidatus Paceibacterota bacterium]
MMRLILKATGIEHTNAIDAYVGSRLRELEKVLDPKEKSCIARVEIAKETKHHKTGADVYKAELTMRTSKKDFRVTATDEADLYAAIDALKDHIVRDIKDHRERVRQQQKDGDRKVKRALKGDK